MTKNVVVTGANRGIGLELARQLKARGEDIIALCRKSSDELDGLGVRVETGIDVGSDGVVDALRSRLEGVAVDILINNAGVLMTDGLDSLDFESARKQYEINSLGPLRVTTALLDNLREGAKIAIVTSRMGSIADNTSGSSYGYRMSKAAVNIAGVSLAHDLKSREIAVTILHPGFVQTGMTGGAGQVTPAESAGMLIERIDELTLETTGRFWHAKGEPLPW